MKQLIDWGTKKNVLIISIFGSIFFILEILFLIGHFCAPSINEDCRSINDMIDQITSVSSWFLILFLFSLITYKLRNEVFMVWRNFSLWFIPLAMFLMLITPDHGGGMLLPTGRAIVGMILPFLYVLISLIIIGWKWNSLRGK